MSTPSTTEQDLRELLSEPVFQAVGEASACWGDLSGAGVFDTDRAKEVGEALLDRVVAVALKAAPMEHDIYTDAESRYLLTVWADGTHELATREHPGMTWSPPVTLGIMR